jgi:diguanylate cyclase (GGDEF)-like protein
MYTPSNNAVPIAILAVLVFNNLMKDSPELNSPNLDNESSPKVITNVRREIGIHAVDTANRVYQTIIDAKAGAEKALENSLVDPLTGCFNQNYFDNKFKTENFNPVHDRNKIAIVYVDYNGLKEINDTPEDQGGGHKVGDQLIKDTAEFLKSQFRGEDIVIRLHGDEFVIICRDRKDGINERKLKIRTAEMKDSAINRTRPLNFATGVAVFDNNIHDDKIDLSLDDTEIRAEQLMYKCKEDMKSAR